MVNFPCTRSRITNSQSLLKLMSIESVMPSNQLILCRPLLLLPSIFPRIRVFFNESVFCIRWPKYWRFSINVSNEYSGLISIRIERFDLLAVPGALKEFFSSTTIWKHQFFGAQPSLWSSSHKRPWLIQDHVFEYQVRTCFIFWDIFGDSCQQHTSFWNTSIWRCRGSENLTTIFVLTNWSKYEIQAYDLVNKKWWR